MGEYRFDSFNTNVEAQFCLFGTRPEETSEAYLKRLQDLWKDDPAARQHLAVFARYQRRGKLRFEGPMADVARDVVMKINN